MDACFTDWVAGLAGDPDAPPVATDPFGMPVNPADQIDWPPADPADFARFEQWVDEMEREAAERYGNDDE